MMNAADNILQTPSRRRSLQAVPVGELLRQWRGARRLSQLDLALDAGISARHLSYVETGKAEPSRERSKYVSKEKPPAATLVGVQSLVRQDFLVEIEVVAMIDQ